MYPSSASVIHLHFLQANYSRVSRCFSDSYLFSIYVSVTLLHSSPCGESLSFLFFIRSTFFLPKIHQPLPHTLSTLTDNNIDQQYNIITHVKIKDNSINIVLFTQLFMLQTIKNNLYKLLAFNFLKTLFDLALKCLNLS